MKDFLTINDITAEQYSEILKLAADIKKDLKVGIQNQSLRGKTLGMIFAKSSTRTRISFDVGMYQLGGYALCLNQSDLQLGRGETVEDTAKVMSRYVDGIMIRTFSHQQVQELAQYASIPVINGLTDDHHPCQAVSDMLTITEVKGGLRGIKIAYIGDGNNIAHSLIQSAALLGITIAVATPAGYEPQQDIVQAAQCVASKSGGSVVLTREAREAVQGADVVYTDTWVSMGQETDKQQRIADFAGYQVDAELFGQAKPDAIFMHDLPAYRGFEVTDQVMSHQRSQIYLQAENRLHAQKAIMVTLMGRGA